jgi:hypothetical protein
LVVVQARREEVVEGAAQAVDVEGAFALIVARGELAGAGNDAGGQLHQLRVFAAIQRQFGDLALVHHLGVLARIGLQLRRLGRGRHGGATVATCSCTSTRWRAPTVSSKLAAEERKPCADDLQPVGANGNVDEVELALCAGGCGQHRRGGRIAQTT